MFHKALPRTGSRSKLRSMGVLIPLEQSSLEKEAKDNTVFVGICLFGTGNHAFF